MNLNYNIYTHIFININNKSNFDINILLILKNKFIYTK